MNEEIIKPVEKNVTDNLLKGRKEKAIKMLKKRGFWILVVLAIIIFLSINIRTQNITNPVNSQGLKDVVTGEWTLGPDLDPFLFLRWAKNIAENGKLMEVDGMRYVPRGYDTSGERKLLSYSIAWLFGIFSFFNNGISIEFVAIIAPVIFFALTLVVFFLLVRKIFEKRKRNANIIALVSTAFLAVIPTMISRTVAGIPEKESLGFLFIFLTLYFFIYAWNSNKVKKIVIFSILAGLSTALLILTWGGLVYVMYAIPIVFFSLFLLRGLKKKNLIIYITWVIVFLVSVQPFYSEYRPSVLMDSVNMVVIWFVFAVFIVNFIFFKTRIKESKIVRKIRKVRIPETLLTVIITVILLIIFALSIFGPGFIMQRSKEAFDSFIHPFGTERFTLTVAENKQPFSNEIISQYGPQIKGIFLFFWLFFIGAIYLFYQMIKKMNVRKRITLTCLFTFLLLGLFYSRYSPNSIFNGSNFVSYLFYFGSTLLFFGYLFYLYYKKKEEFSINFSYLLVIVFFLLTVYAAKGAIRLVMVIAPMASLLVGLLVVDSIRFGLKKEKGDLKKIFAWVFMILIVISAIYSFYFYYNSAKNELRGYIPGDYNWQWQRAMAWVRENTNQNAVFAHWWDYGYWVQTIGERATILDGGNSIVYWDYLMGRHVLTGQTEREALDFLYSHDATHLLIDSTDIGKYPAFSSIGSNLEYDRYGNLPILRLNEKGVQEGKDKIYYPYVGGSPINKDIIRKQDGEEIFIPAGFGVQGNTLTHGFGGVVIGKTSEGYTQPIGIYVYKGKSHSIPLRYLYDGELQDFGTGYEAGIYMLTSIDQSEGNLNINDLGAVIYLDPVVIKSNLVRLYLFDSGERFKLVHSEDSYFLKEIKKQNPSLINLQDIVLLNGELKGPIKIWKIEYPSGLEDKEIYLQTKYPDPKLKISKDIY